MNPLRSLHLLALAAAALAHPCPATEPAAGQPLPNILWISVEDMSCDLGAYGDTFARTPNLDQLARDGMRCERAFSTFPVCAPSRASIITGVFAGTLGAHEMRTGVKGYEAVPPPEVKLFTEYLRAAGYYCVNHTKTDYQFKPPATAWDALKGDWRNRDRRPDQPFFSVINLTTTHESKCFKLRPTTSDPQTVPVPPFYPDTPRVREVLAIYYDNVAKMDTEAGEILARLKADGLDQKTIVFFWADHGRGLPRCKRWPYDTGLRVPLIVRWPGRIEPGTVNQELLSLLDLAPTVLSLTGREVPRHLHGRIILGPGKQPEPEYIFGGRNRMDLGPDDFIRTARSREFRYLHNFTPEVPHAHTVNYMEQSPLMQEWRRLHAAGQLTGAAAAWFDPRKPDEELYDTAKDPFQLHNLAADPAHAATLQKMRAAVDQWMESVNDLGRVPEEQLIERFKPGGQQPVTAPPQFTAQPDGRLALTCATPGASIGFRRPGTRTWQVYVAPLPAVEEFEALAHRIGYRPSEVVKHPR
jgi:uncharacterized sulfatase